MVVLEAALSAMMLFAAERVPLCALTELRGLPCVNTPNGAVVGAEPAEAAKLVQAITAAEGRFSIRFGRQPPAYALLVGGVPDTAMRALTAAGAASLLPWVPEKEQIRAMRISFLKAAMRRPGAEDAVRASGLTEADVLEAADEFWDNLGIDIQPSISASTVAAHELGHDWFEAAFPFRDALPQGNRYGTPGPDWLDEASALSVEDEAAFESRRQEFSKAWKGGGPTPDPVDVFLTRAHPSMANSSGSAETELSTVTLPDGAKVITRTGVTINDGPASDIYYPQARVFSDFLISQSGDAGVLGSIAEAVADGRSFESWLADSAPGQKLGGSLERFEEAWRKWLVTRYGPPSTTH